MDCDDEYCSDTEPCDECYALRYGHLHPKWMADGSTSLDEAASHAEAFAAELRALAKDHRLTEQVSDGWIRFERKDGLNVYEYDERDTSHVKYAQYSTGASDG